MASRAAPPTKTPDPIDLAASAIASRIACMLAAEIAAALRRLELQPSHLAARHDPTAAARQRRHRAQMRSQPRKDSLP